MSKPIEILFEHKQILASHFILQTLLIALLQKKILQESDLLAIYDIASVNVKMLEIEGTDELRKAISDYILANKEVVLNISQSLQALTDEPEL